MRLFTFLLLLFCSANGYTQKLKSVSFSVTDKTLLAKITGSPDVDLSVVMLNGHYQPESRMVSITLELYYYEFLRAVNQLRNTVELKYELAELPYNYPELYFNKEALDQAAEVTVLKAYASEDYDTIFNRVKESFTVFQNAATDPAVTVYDDFHEKRAGEDSVYKEEMMKTVKKIMNNLTLPRNALTNKECAQEALVYYQTVHKK